MLNRSFAGLDNFPPLRIESAPVYPHTSDAVRIQLSLRWLVLSCFLFAFPLSSALALPACPGQNFYLKSGEVLEIEFNRRPGCDVRFVAVERGVVDRKLFYPSGKTDERRLSARERDIPEAWSLLPQKAQLRANTETVVKFLGEAPRPASEPASPFPDKPTLREICGGDRVELKRGENLFFRFSGSQCKERVERVNIIGEVNEQVLYPSGKRDQRILRTGMTWNYSEQPRAIFWKAIVPTEAIFVAQAPAPLPNPPTPALPQQIAKPAPAPPQAPSQLLKPAPPVPVLQPPPPPPPPAKTSTIFTREFFTQTLLFIASAFAIYIIVWFSKKPSVQVIGHWCCSIECLQASPMQFYASVEEAITSRNIPAINYHRTDWREAGVFSAYREYLRVIRERNVFDICGAPYGNGFFVSWWFGEMRPSPLGPTVATAGIVYGFYTFTTHLFGTELGFLITIIGFILSFLFIGLVMRNNPGEYWISYMLVIPIIGFLLEHMFLPPTYYRIDSALMFQESIKKSVLEVIDGMTTAKGIRALSEDERKPVLKDFFQRKMPW